MGSTLKAKNLLLELISLRMNSKIENSGVLSQKGYPVSLILLKSVIVTITIMCLYIFVRGEYNASNNLYLTMKSLPLKIIICFVHSDVQGKTRTNEYEPSSASFSSV